MLDILAKLLAQENITLQRGNYRTASFDIEKRVVRIPNLVGMTNSEELLMIFHEVGHALFTDTSYVEEVKAQRASKRNFGQYLNIIEDARIERKIKDMYPGARRDFYTGYRSLNDRDFFGIVGRDLSNMALIDRINLYFKVGVTSGVIFNKEEMVFVERADRTETLQQVIDLANDVYAYAAANKKETPSPTFDSDIDEGDDEEESDDDLYDYEYSVEESGTDSADDGDRVSGGAVEEENDVAPESTTQQAFDKSVKSMTSTDNSAFVQPVLSSAHATVDFSAYAAQQRGHRDFNLVGLNETKMALKRSASYMFREFTMKKAASRYSRQTQSKSGSLNLGKLYQYKTSDDLFRKYNIVADDKNHGMFVLLDFSGSMTSTMSSALLEIYTLCLFCNMAKIPFSVRMFVAGDLPPELYGKNGVKVFNKNRMFNPHSQKFAGHQCSTIVGQPMTLVEIASSDVKFKEVEASLLRSIVHDFGLFRMANTPLTESYLLLLNLIPQFQQKNRLEKVSLVTITDGSGGMVNFVDNEGSACFGDVFIEDKKTGKKYSTERSNTYKTVMQILRDRYSFLSVVGFFIIPKRTSGNIAVFVSSYLDSHDSHDAAANNQKVADLLTTMKDGTIKTKIQGYDSMMIFVGNSIREEFSIDKVKATSSVSSIANQFTKGMKAGINNKVVLSNLVEHIS